MKPGEGRLAKCLADELSVENQPGHTGAKIGPGCITALTGFRIQRSTNINMDLPLAKACKSDADKFCANKYEVGCSHIPQANTITQHEIEHLVGWRQEDATQKLRSLHRPILECLMVWTSEM